MEGEPSDFGAVGGGDGVRSVGLVGDGAELASTGGGARDSFSTASIPARRPPAHLNVIIRATTFTRSRRVSPCFTTRSAQRKPGRAKAGGECREVTIEAKADDGADGSSEAGDVLDDLGSL
ncbi:hypothetical protein NL676_026127 [Syzygium grande]|nr:hypothetical protein NL676_026127 [Syzygium grande]